MLTNNTEANMKSLPKFDKTWKPDFMAPGPKVKIEEMADPLSLVLSEQLEDVTDDPVVAIDPEERKTRYYPSPHILGKIYRLVDEKGFYEQLQDQTKAIHRSQNVLAEILVYAQRAIEPFDFKQYINDAREIRSMYEEQVVDISYKFTLHSAHPLHEMEIITGAVLGSIFVRRLRELTSDMKDRYAREIEYFRERIRYDDQGSDNESMPRALACLYIGVKERGRKVGRHGDVRMWSWPYVAAAVCLEEIARFNGGRLPAL
jgi:acetolactate synthase regulatory subunit